MSDARERGLTEFLAEAEFDAALLARVHWKSEKGIDGDGISPVSAAERIDRCGRGIGDAARPATANRNPEAVRDLIDAELTDVAGGFSMLQHGCSMRTGGVPGQRVPAVWGTASSVQRFFGL